MGIQMRVTEGSISTRVLANLQRNMARGAQIQEQLSTGKQISRPSDSPTGTLTSMQLRGETRSYEQYSRNANDGLGWLSAVESSLSESATLVNRARELTLQGLNSGVGSSTSREALKLEIDSIKEALIGQANSKYLDRPIFGGTTTASAAYTAAGTYQGDAGAVVRTVGANAKVRVDASAQAAFGTDGTDTQLFKVLQDISDSLRDNDSDKLRTGLQNLDTAGNRLKSQLSDVGARYNRVSQMNETAQDRLVTLKGQLSDVEDIDLPQTIMEMKLQETAYEAALAATAKVIQPSLIDYLR